MKALLLSVALLFSFQSAHAKSSEGALVFKKDGELVKIAASMDHSEVKGENGKVKHEVTLHVEHAGVKTSLVAKRIRMQQLNGKTTVTVAFEKGEGRAIFKGTVMKGKTSAIYYGDIFAMEKKGSAGGGFFDLFENNEEEGHKLGKKPKIHFVGGFVFHFTE